jgi:hypothetical protein
MNAESQLLVLLTALGLFVVNAIVRRRSASLRPLAPIAQLPRFAAESLEANRPLHLALSGVTLGGADTLLALVGADFLVLSAKQIGIGSTSPIYTSNQTSTLTLGRDILRRTFADNPLNKTPFLPSNVRWFPDGRDSVTFAAAVTAMQSDDKLAGNVMVGNYGAELALMLWASQRAKRLNIAHSVQLTGQAVAFAMADSFLLGEEVFAAGGYGDDAGLRNRAVVLDVVRFLVVLVLLVVFIVTLLRGI